MIQADFIKRSTKSLFHFLQNGSNSVILSLLDQIILIFFNEMRKNLKGQLGDRRPATQGLCRKVGPLSRFKGQLEKITAYAKG
jgi:hypothetical protein